MTDETNAAPEGTGETPVTNTAIDQATAVERIMAMDAPEPEPQTPEKTEEAAANPESTGETTGGDEPSKDKTELDADTELQLKGDAKTRLRDGREVSIADLKRRFEKADEYEAELGKAREREASAQQTAQQQQLLQQHLPNILQQLQATLPQAPDYALAESDPVEFMVQKAKYDRAVEQYRAVEAAQAEQQAKSKAEQDAQFKAYLQKEQELILEKIPELKDPERAKKFQGDYLNAASHYGFSPDEAGQVYDHRLLVMIKDAMSWREAQAQKAEAVEKARAPQNSTVLSPQRRVAQAERNSATVNEAVARARKSGSMEDAIAAMSALDA